MGYVERAAESYAKVVDLAPLHLDARISLSTLQQQLGRPEKALEALEPMYDPDTLAQDANAAQQVGEMPHDMIIIFCVGSFVHSSGVHGSVKNVLLNILAMLVKDTFLAVLESGYPKGSSGERFPMGLQREHYKKKSVATVFTHMHLPPTLPYISPSILGCT